MPRWPHASLNGLPPGQHRSVYPEQIGFRTQHTLRTSWPLAATVPFCLANDKASSAGHRGCWNLEVDVGCWSPTRADLFLASLSPPRPDRCGRKSIAACSHTTISRVGKTCRGNPPPLPQSCSPQEEPTNNESKCRHLGCRPFAYRPPG